MVIHGTKGADNVIFGVGKVGYDGIRVQSRRSAINSNRLVSAS